MDYSLFTEFEADVLKQGPGLISLLGTDNTGEPRIYRAAKAQPKDYPCLTWKLENSMIRPSCGFYNNQRREYMQVILFNIWSRTSDEEAYAIEEALDKLMMGGLDGLSVPLAGCHGQAKISRSMMFEDSLGAWHAVVRYSVDFTLTEYA